MPILTLYNQKIESVFELLGRDEDDITYSLDWGLYSSKSFLKEFLKNTISWQGDIDTVEIRLQQSELRGGRTDIEIALVHEFHIIIEDKRGWNLTSLEQLRTYSKRESFAKSNTKLKKILVLSECSNEYFKSHFRSSNIGGIPLDSISYKSMLKLAELAVRKGNNAEKSTIRQLRTYLVKIMSLQNITSNLVYVVSISTDKPKGWGISWIDII